MELLSAVSFLADNLASHALGGFKESFSFAVRICRSCNATNESYRTCFNSNGFDLRCESHNMKHNVSSYMGHYNHTILSVMALIAAVV